MITLAIAAAFIPRPGSPDPGVAPVSEMPSVSICPIVEAGERHTMVSVLSSISGPGRLSTFSAGEESGALQFTTGSSGSVTISAADASAIGLAGGLIELPSEATASGVTITGGESLSAESCGDVPSGQSYVMGGSTASGRNFELQLLNPYAGDATVDLTVTTDAGLESDPRFDGVIIPALSSLALDFSQLIPGRATISVNIATTRGSVIAFARQTNGPESALWRAVEPAQDWWLPAPAGSDVRELIIGSPTNTEVSYQVDLYGPDGFIASFETGTISPRGEVRLSLTNLTTAPLGLRVITDAPVVAGLTIDAAVGLAVTTGSPVDATTWLLPGASSPIGGSASLLVLNTGLETVTVSVRSLREASVSRDFEVPAEGVHVVELVQADGYRVESSGPVVALWTSRGASGAATSIGIPLDDG